MAIEVMQTYDRVTTSAVSLLSNREIDVNERFDLVAQTIQLGARIVAEEHTHALRLQKKVDHLSDENKVQNDRLKESEEKVQKLEDEQKKYLDAEVAKKVKSLALKEKIYSYNPALGISIGLAGVFYPSALLGAIVVVAKGEEKKEEAFKEQWILTNYPKSLFDKKVRAKAEKKYEEEGHEEFVKKYSSEDGSYFSLRFS